MLLVFFNCYVVWTVKLSPHLMFLFEGLKLKGKVIVYLVIIIPFYKLHVRRCWPRGILPLSKKKMENFQKVTQVFYWF